MSAIPLNPEPSQPLALAGAETAPCAQFEKGRILFAVRENPSYATTLPAIVAGLREQGLNVDLVMVPRGSDPLACRLKVQEAAGGVVYEQGFFDRTVAYAVDGQLATVALDCESIEDILGLSASDLIRERFGVELSVSPNELRGETEQVRYQAFRQTTETAICDLLRIALRSGTPNQVWIFSEQLEDHVPFFWLKENGEDPGLFLKSCLVKIGYPIEDIVLVADLDDIDALARRVVDDPIVTLVNAPYVMLIGDTHRLTKEFLIDAACRACAVDRRCAEIVCQCAEKLSPPERLTGPMSEIVLRLSGESEALYDAGTLDLARTALHSFGVLPVDGPDVPFRRVVVHFPVVNCLVELARGGCFESCWREISRQLIERVGERVKDQLTIMRARSATMQSPLRLVHCPAGSKGDLDAK